MDSEGMGFQSARAVRNTPNTSRKTRNERFFFSQSFMGPLVSAVASVTSTTAPGPGSAAKLSAPAALRLPHPLLLLPGFLLRNMRPGLPGFREADRDRLLA